MKKIAGWIIRYRKTMVTVFLISAIICAFLQMFVAINYNMVDYLPPEAQSTAALEIMDREFTQSIPNLNVMVKDVSVQEAMDYKQKLLEIEGIMEVMWLDDMIDIKQPLEMQDKETIEGFYKNSHALFSATVEDGKEVSVCADVRQLIGAENAISGEAADTEFMQQATGSEAMKAMAILMPVIIFILIVSTTSWIEPILFMATIGVSILINMGTGIFLGEISFMTNSVSPILQIAVSLDYSIFLLHSFADNRKRYDDPSMAMRKSILNSMTTVAASAVTTLFGFLALMFMNFRIGADLGFTLAKGIVISFICAMVFLPALTLCAYRWIDKTRHRDFMPGFKNINKVLSKFALPALVIVTIAVGPSFLGQSETAFFYGNGDPDPATQNGRDAIAINEEFGQSTVMALLVPGGDIAREAALCKELHELDHISGVMSYSATVGTAVPRDILAEEIVGQFYSENYARIIIYTDTPEEGELAFRVVEMIYEVVENYYQDSYYAAGQSANLYDMREVVKKDNSFVNMIAIISIFFVLLISFKSLTLPIILLLTIEAGIWINLSFPYFTGTSVSFIGYLVLNTVQLGATVDYAILLTDHYMGNRKRMSQREAITKSLGDAFKSILVSATTLATAGFTLYLTSTNVSISDIGLLLGRGTVMSFLMVVCFLPAMLMIFDKLINKTTYRANFYMEKKQKNAGGELCTEKK